MIDLKRILVPTDFSEPSEAALSFGVRLARAFGARLHLLHVPASTGENFEADFAFGPFDHAAGQIETLVAQSEATPLRPEYAIRIGSPAAEIVRYAADRDIDIIVMGTHGRTGAAHLLMGSVAERVVRDAQCPVMTVHQPRPASVEADDARAATAKR